MNLSKTFLFTEAPLFLFALCMIWVISGCSAAGDEKNNAPKDYKATGRIVSVDKVKSIATIDHEKIEGLMSAMTMDFPVLNTSLLKSIERGDEVEFTLRHEGDDLKVTAIRRTGSRLPNGSEIYKVNCARCHGDKGEGAKKGIPLIEGHALGHPLEDFLEQVKNGGKKMPTFSDKLTDEEIVAVVNYVREDIQKGLRKEASHEH